jgi:hypothetical protein
MRLRLVFLVALVALIGIAFGLGSAQDKAKYTIAEVMKEAHSGKPKLCEKVAGGTASKAEAEKLLELYTALAANKCPKGDAKSWEEKTKALVEAAKACIADPKTGGAKLKAAVNCAGCHKAHKG